MDGVLCRNGRLIPGVDLFIAKLLQEGIPFRFLTNSSQRIRRDVATRPDAWRSPSATSTSTCAMGPARYLACPLPGGTACDIGEGGLPIALHENGLPSWIKTWTMSWWRAARSVSTW